MCYVEMEQEMFEMKADAFEQIAVGDRVVCGVGSSEMLRFRVVGKRVDAGRVQLKVTPEFRRTSDGWIDAEWFEKEEGGDPP